MSRIRVGVRAYLLIVACVLSAFAQQSVSSSSTAQVPSLVNFSGVLTDVNGKPLTGVVGVTFYLYKDQQGGTPLWIETQNAQPDKSGHYSVMLGSTTGQGLPAGLFVSGEARWLGVQAQGQAEQPRVMLLSVPYALKAGDAATVGGLPPSAFVLAAPGDGTAANGSNGSTPVSSPPPGSSDVTTTGGTVNDIPLWTTSTNIQSSAITQSGTGKTAKIGINNSKPASTLDVKGASTLRGQLNLPATATATATAGFNSQPMEVSASAYNSGTGTAVSQNFQWQAEPAGNDTSSASGTLNLLFGQGTNKLAETGLNIASNGQITFASGQTFPGTGTVTSIGSGAGLTGGPITSSGTLSIASAGVTNAMLANPSLTVNAGTALSGGGNVSLGGSTTLNVDTTKVPLLSASNTFTGNQTVNGNLSATGVVTGSGFQIGSNLFDYGSYANQNAFLGFAGNTTTTGIENTATGLQALFSVAAGSGNTANGEKALYSDTAGGNNTAVGTGALYSNTNSGVNTAIGSYALYTSIGSENTATGASALASDTTGSLNTAAGFQAGLAADNTNVTGSSDTLLGGASKLGTGSLNNATAIGANSEVTESNALVLGVVASANNGVPTNVGIGTTAPAYGLDVYGTGHFTQAVTFGSPVNFASGQTFPGTGTITGVRPGAGLTGGGSSGNVSVSIPSAGVTNAMLANSSLTVNAGTALTGGGAVALGSNTTLNVDTTKVPLLAAANTFTGNQAVNGNVSATGYVSGAEFQIGSTLFAYGSYTNGNAFSGFAGNPGLTGNYNTAVGVAALSSNTTGGANTATGLNALVLNTTGSANTASGYWALESNSTGSFNTASGFDALAFNSTGGSNTANGPNALYANTTGSANSAFGSGALGAETTGANNTGLGSQAGATGDGKNTTGSFNTFVGALAQPGGSNETTLSNATAIGAQTLVSASNSMVLGSINGVNNATASTNVGIGTTAPGSLFVASGVDSTSDGKEAAIQLSNTASGGGDWYIRSGATGNNTPAGAISIANDSSYVMTIASNGYVGLGDSYPALNPKHPLTMVDGAYESGGTWTNASDRNLKEDFTKVDGRALLTKLAAISIESWNYKSEGRSVRHLGPMAQDFFAAFALGSDDKHISTVDEGGVALAAVQELYREGLKRDAEVRVLKQQASDYQRLAAALMQATEKQQREIAFLRRQLTFLQARSTPGDHKQQARVSQTTLRSPGAARQ